MPWSRKLECPDCGNQWTALLMKRTERNPPCEVCQAKPVEGLAAPGLAFGAKQVTALKIPENPTKRIDFAMRVISEDNHGANMKSKTKVGEAAAIDIPTKPGEAPIWGGGGGAGSYQQGITMAGNDPTRGNDHRAGLLDGLADKRRTHMAPVYRDRKKA